MSIENPCVGVCKLHTKYKICIGCYRSPVELRRWSNYTEDEKKLALQRINIRKNTYANDDSFRF
jgi:predicted Fe-S protein YdhL (DUF1289 family)